jgi:hypothetical protein
MSCPYADNNQPAPCHFEPHPKKVGSFFCCVCQQSSTPGDDKPAEKPKLSIALILLILLAVGVVAIPKQRDRPAPKNDAIVEPFR